MILFYGNFIWKLAWIFNCALENFAIVVICAKMNDNNNAATWACPAQLALPQHIQFVLIFKWKFPDYGHGCKYSFLAKISQINRFNVFFRAKIKIDMNAAVHQYYKETIF